MWNNSIYRISFYPPYISNLLQYVTPKIQSVSPEELLEKEMQEIRELLFDFPENMIDRVAEKVKELKKIESKNE